MRFFARIWMQTDLSALVSTVPLLRTTTRFKFASAALLGLGGSFVPNSLVTFCVWRCCMRLHSVDRELSSDCGVDDRHVTSHGSRPRQPVRTDRPCLRHPCHRIVATALTILCGLQTCSGAARWEVQQRRRGGGRGTQAEAHREGLCRCGLSAAASHPLDGPCHVRSRPTIHATRSHSVLTLRWCIVQLAAAKRARGLLIERPTANSGTLSLKEKRSVVYWRWRSSAPCLKFDRRQSRFWVRGV